jgi:hypothetical protein
VRVRADDGGTDKGEADVLPRLQPDGSKIIELNSPIENLNSEAQNRLGVPQGGGDKVLADLVDAGGANYDGLTSNWYGQTPNKNDASQSGATNQPQIVSSGSVIQENGRPAIEFDGSDDKLSHFLGNITLNNVSIFAVANSRDISLDFTALYKIFADSELRSFQQNNDLRFNALGVRHHSNIYNKNFISSHLAINTNQLINRLNQNENIASGFNSLPITNANELRVGDRVDDTWTGSIQEMVFYFVNKYNNVTDIEDNMNKFYNNIF